MNVCDVGGISRAFVTVMMFPIIMIRPILEGISEKYALIQSISDAGGQVSAGIRWGLVKEVLVLLFILMVIALIIGDTLRRTMLAGVKPKDLKARGYDLAIALTTLFVYYFMISIGLYVIMNVMLPICRTL
ncbi:hypothetical protein ACFL1W_00070 [Candidatus Margulisiibacteriota bacterium]